MVTEENSSFKVFAVIQNLFAEDRFFKYLTHFLSRTILRDWIVAWVFFCFANTAPPSLLILYRSLEPILRISPTWKSQHRTIPLSLKQIWTPLHLPNPLWHLPFLVRLVKLLPCGLALGGIWSIWLEEVSFWSETSLGFTKTGYQQL